MIIKDASEINRIDLESLKLIGYGFFGSVYQYGDKVLKVFRNIDKCKMLEKEHNEQFLDFLIRLDGMKNPILVRPTEIFKTSNEIVLGYVTDYIKGTKMDRGLDSIDINAIMNVLINFYQELIKLEDLVLYDATATNLILEKGIKVIDLDLAQFEDHSNRDVIRKNLQILNSSIFRALITQGNYGRLTNTYLKEIEEAIIFGEDSLPVLLAEYIKYINEHCFKVKSVMDLSYPYFNRV